MKLPIHSQISTAAPWSLSMDDDIFPNIILHVITYPSCEWSYSIFVKGATCVFCYDLLEVVSSISCEVFPRGNLGNCMIAKIQLNRLGPLLLTWFNFNPSKDSNYILYKEWAEINYPFLNFNGVTVEV